MTQAHTSHAVLVLGMHRSGTSAATGALVRRGVWPGEKLLPATEENPKGYWENSDIYTIHEQLLTTLGHAWDDVRPLPDGWIQQEATATARDQLRTLITGELMQHPVWVVKDPRLCRLLPLWRPLLEELGVVASVVIVVRDPREVAASLLARNQWPVELSRELWWQHLADAIHGSHGLPRHVLAYPRLLADPVMEINDTVDALPLALPPLTPAIIADLQEFVSTTIRHHQADTDAAPQWETALSLYRHLSQQPVDWDSVQAMLRGNTLLEQPLGTVVGEYARLYTNQRFELHSAYRQLARTRSECDDTWEKLNQTRAQWEHASAELGHMRSELGQVRAELQHTRRELGHVRGELGHVRGELGHVRGERDTFQAQYHATQHQLQLILTSRSWRLTRPLRWLTERLRFRTPKP